MKHKISIKRSYEGDWVGIYLNGELQMQNESFSENQIFAFMTKIVKNMEIEVLLMTDQEEENGMCEQKL